MSEGEKLDPSLAKINRAGEEMASERPGEKRTNKVRSKSWGKRPATGHSFLVMMVLAVLATAFALFLTLHSPAEQRTEAPLPATPRGQASPSQP